MAVKSVLFDMGNTLIDFESRPLDELHEAAVGAVHARLSGLVGRDRVPGQVDFRALLARIWESVEERHRPNSGQPTLNEALQAVLNDLSISASRSLLHDLELAHYETFRVQIRPDPEAREVLEGCLGRGLRLALISNTIWSPHLHREDLARFDLGRYFHRIVFSPDFGRRKPHPAIFMHVLDGFATLPEEAVVVGDRIDADIQGARNAGCMAVLKVHPFSCLEGQDRVSPDAVIHSLKEILSFLDTLIPDYS